MDSETRRRATETAINSMLVCAYIFVVICALWVGAVFQEHMLPSHCAQTEIQE